MVWYVFDVIALAVHCFMNTEILVHVEVRIDIYRFVAECADIDLFVFLLICHTLMRFD